MWLLTVEICEIMDVMTWMGLMRILGAGSSHQQASRRPTEIELLVLKQGKLPLVVKDIFFGCERGAGGGERGKGGGCFLAE